MLFRSYFPQCIVRWKRWDDGLFWTSTFGVGLASGFRLLRLTWTCAGLKSERPNSSEILSSFTAVSPCRPNGCSEKKYWARSTGSNVSFSRQTPSYCEKFTIIYTNFVCPYWLEEMHSRSSDLFRKWLQTQIQRVFVSQHFIVVL